MENSLSPDSPLPIIVQLNSRRIIKICPDCAIKHFAQCENRAADSEESCGKCDDPSIWAPSSVSLAHLLLLAFRCVLAMTGALMRLVLAQLAAAEFLVKLVCYALDSVKWVRQERNTTKAVVKGAACGVATFMLCYIAWVLLFYMILPSLGFISDVLRSGYSLI